MGQGQQRCETSRQGPPLRGTHLVGIGGQRAAGVLVPCGTVSAAHKCLAIEVAVAVRVGACLVPGESRALSFSGFAKRKEPVTALLSRTSTCSCLGAPCVMT
jgi:hypothetical protein